MARAGLSLGVRELAESARVSVGTVSRFESGQGVPEMTIGLFQKALERAGVEFVADGGDVGVWLRKGVKGAATIPSRRAERRKRRVRRAGARSR